MTENRRTWSYLIYIILHELTLIVLSKLLSVVRNSAQYIDGHSKKSSFTCELPVAPAKTLKCSSLADLDLRLRPAQECEL